MTTSPSAPGAPGDRTTAMGSTPAAVEAPRPGRLYRLIAGVSRPVVTTLYRLRVEGSENLPAHGGFVVAANHTSNFDPWPLGIALWPRPVHFMVKQEAWWPPLRWVLAPIGTFPVRRDQSDVGALLTATEFCRQGHVMAMFPEGTRREKGLRKKRQPRPHSGAAFIALEAGVPLIPAALAGTDRLTRLGPMRVLFGAAIPLDDVKQLRVRDAAHATTRRLWAEIQRLEAELEHTTGRARA